MIRSCSPFLQGLFVAIVTAGAASATPIVYSGYLLPGVPVTGTINQPSWHRQDPEGAVYYALAYPAVAGTTVVIEGHRIDWGYDMAFWVYQGLYSDTSEFGGSFSWGAPGFIGSGDDEIPHPGPWGDPLIMFTTPATDYYTVAVTNYASEGSPPFSFTLRADYTPIPEPSSMALLGFGLAGVFATRRRRPAAE